MENLDKITNEILNPTLSLEDRKVIEGRINRVRDGYIVEFDRNSSVVFQFRKYPEGKKYSKRIVVTRHRNFHGVKDSKRIGLFEYNEITKEKLNSICYDKMADYIEENLRLNGKGRVYHINTSKI